MAAKAQRAPNPMIAAALDYAARGWRVHPTHSIKEKGGVLVCTCNKADCPPKHNGKHPLLGEWQIKATTNELELCSLWDRYPFANVAIATGEGSDLVVLDVDPDTGGLESFRKLENDFGTLPATITARSGSGGYHWYFRHPGIRIQNRNPIPGYPGLDIRGDGGYIMAPPSRHRSGESYRWQEGDNDLAHMPAAFVEMLLSIGKSDRPVEGLPVVEVKRGDPATWLHKAIRKAAPGNRNATGFWLATQLRDDSVSEAEAEYLMLQYAAAVSESGNPYADSEARASLRQAYNSTPRQPARSTEPRRIGPPSLDDLPPTGEDKPPEDTTLTDMGNAERLRARHGDNIRYVYEWKSWLVWTGKHWQRDNGDLIMRRAKETARAIVVETEGVDDDKQAQLIYKWAMHSRGKKPLENMIMLTQDLCTARPADFDQDTMLWNSPNGTTDLRTGEIRPHNRSDMITKMSPIERRPDATCPLWLANLRRFMAEDEDMVSYLQRWAGYVLTGDVSERSLEIAYGPGSNFKGTFFDSLQNIWGEYARAIATDTLMVTKYDRSGPEMAQLPGIRLAIASEGEDGQSLAVARVKRMTGGVNERITAEAKYEKPFEFVPTHKTILMTNKLPVIRDTTNSIWNRVHLQPWAVTIPPEEVDPRYPERLEAEYSGILEWAVQGCLLWLQGGLRPPQTVLQATNAYRGDMNIVAQFIEAKCECDRSAEEKAEPLYLAFKIWCEEHNERAPRGNDFASRMKENGYESHRTKHGIIWRGLRLWRPEANEQDSMFRDNKV